MLQQAFSRPQKLYSIVRIKKLISSNSYVPCYKGGVSVDNLTPQLFFKIL